MTPLELWQAGRGEEPLVRFRFPSLAITHTRWSRWTAYCSIANAFEQHEREEQAAAEECRAAMAAALCGGWVFDRPAPEACIIEVAILYPSGQRDTARAYRDYEAWRTTAGYLLLSKGDGGGSVYAWRPIPPAPPSCATLKTARELYGEPIAWEATR